MTTHDTDDATDDRRSLTATSVHLAPGLHAAECVNPDGATALWLLVEHPDGHGCEHPGCACAGCAPHERDGRLPVEWRIRLGLQCGWVNPRSGKRCRTSVDRAGDNCPRHTGTVVACGHVFADGRRCRTWTNDPTGYCQPGHYPWRHR